MELVPKFFGFQLAIDAHELVAVAARLDQVVHRLGAALLLSAASAGFVLVAAAFALGVFILFFVVVFARQGRRRGGRNVFVVGKLFDVDVLFDFNVRLFRLARRRLLFRQDIFGRQRICWPWTHRYSSSAMSEPKSNWTRDLPKLKSGLLLADSGEDGLTCARNSPWWCDAGLLLPMMAAMEKSVALMALMADAGGAAATCWWRLMRQVSSSIVPAGNICLVFLLLRTTAKTKMIVLQYYTWSTRTQSCFLFWLRRLVNGERALQLLCARRVE